MLRSLCSSYCSTPDLYFEPCSKTHRHNLVSLSLFIKQSSWYTKPHYCFVWSESTFVRSHKKVCLFKTRALSGQFTNSHYPSTQGQYIIKTRGFDVSLKVIQDSTHSRYTVYKNCYKLHITKHCKWGLP